MQPRGTYDTCRTFFFFCKKEWHKCTTDTSNPTMTRFARIYFEDCTPLYTIPLGNHIRMHDRIFSPYHHRRRREEKHQVTPCFELARLEHSYLCEELSTLDASSTTCLAGRVVPIDIGRSACHQEVLRPCLSISTPSQPNSRI